jgi:predicted transcriptional regulator
MANTLDPMDLKQIITLHIDGLSNRKIGVLLGISRNTVNNYMQLFNAGDHTFEELLQMDNSKLNELFTSHTTINNNRYDELMSYFEKVNQARNHPGFTFQFHYEEYRLQVKNPYSYTQFLEHYALTTSHRFLLYRKVTDFRKGFDGLCGLVQNELDREPTSGEVFIFINRSRDRIKLLHWQHGGFVLYYKRLEKGTISLPSLDSKSTSCQVSYTDLVLMIEGISVERVVQKERYTNHLKTVKNR